MRGCAWPQMRERFLSSQCWLTIGGMASVAYLCLGAKLCWPGHGCWCVEIVS